MFGTLALAVILSAPQAQIDRYIAPYVAGKDFSGVILVKQDGKTLYRKAVGCANFELGAKNNGDTVFRIASLTKTFTSGAIYLLEKQGKLAFTDLLSKYLPTFPKASEITITHLLSHQSGVGAPDMDILNHQEPTIDEVIETIAKAPFQFEPGKDNSYSNSGYTLLAKVVEVASGKSYGQFLQDEFFKPLGMKNTGNYIQAEFIPNRANPYFPGPPPADVTPVPGYDELSYLGAGSLWSTADDLSKWLTAVRTNRFYEIDKLSWPMGWGKREYFGKRANEQTGISTGFTSGMIYFPAEKLEVIILSNVQTQFAGKAVVDISGIVLGQPPKPLSRPAACDMSRVNKSQVLGKYQTESKDVLEIVDRRGHLYYHWNNDSEFRYLMPVAATELYVRDEFARWTWKDKDTLSWAGPFGAFDLKRVQ